MIVYDQQHHPLNLGTVVGRGGEAVVYRIDSQPNRLAKIYEPAPRPDYIAKLSWMIEHAPMNPTREQSHPALAWPDGLVFDVQGRLRGYCMPFIRRTTPVLDVFNPRRRAEVMPPFFDRRYLHRVARNLAGALHALHRSGYVAGDLNESNILVTHTALITLIDTDSFQVNAQVENGSVVYPCPVGKLEYTAPELQGQRLSEVVRRPEQDSFGLAVLIFQLLMEGNHPFRAQWLAAGEPPPLEKRIAQGAFPYTASPTAPVLPPKHAPDLNLLNPWLAELLRRCFLDGHRNPTLRPTPETWRNAIIDAELSLKACPVGHYYSDHLNTCPYCAARGVSGRAVPLRPVAARPVTAPSQGRAAPGVRAPQPAASRPANNPFPANSPIRTGNPATAQPVPPRPNGPAGAYAASRPVGQRSPPARSRFNPASRPGGVTWSMGTAPAGGSAASTAAASTVSSGSSASGNSAAAPWLRGRGSYGMGWGSGPARPPAAVFRRVNLRTWLREQLMRSLMVGGAQGALVGLLPGMLVGLYAGMGSQDLTWSLLFALGGAAGGFSRGWQPGYRLAKLIEQWIGWQRFWRAAGLVIGATLGMALGIAFFWAIFPLILGPLFGARTGRSLGDKIWLSGRTLGWERIWAVLGAALTAGFGWVIAGLVGASFVSDLGSHFVLALEYGGVRPLLTAIVAGAFCSSLGGMTAGIISEFVAGLLGLAD